jgi:hypothetical protein
MGAMFAGWDPGISVPLLIPIAGPFISGLMMPSVYWTVPWILVDGAAQVAGLAMAIVGATHKKRVAVIGMDDRLRITPYATADGGGISAIGRF